MLTETEQKLLQAISNVMYGFEAVRQESLRNFPETYAASKEGVVPVHNMILTLQQAAAANSAARDAEGKPNLMFVPFGCTFTPAALEKIKEENVRRQQANPSATPPGGSVPSP